MTRLNLQSEAALDPAIQFPHPAYPSDPRAILLTGATGFLGAALLDQLLRETDAEIYCLIRGDDETSAMARLKRKLVFHGLWDVVSAERIHPVVGNLGKPCLGLSPRQHNQLAERIDVIYHNGAQVNAMYPYARLKESNVLGTERILRLAGAHHTKPVHFVSTLGVFFSDRYQGETVMEDSPIFADESMRGGYKQSKWVAEQLVQQAHLRGLPVTIHRPGRIWGDSRTGIMTEFGDLLVTMVRASVLLGCFPSAETTLNLTPVDFASRAIIQLSQHPSGQIYHICNPQPVAWRTFWNTIRDCGYPLDEVDYATWAAAIKQRGRVEREQKVWSVLRHLLRAPIYMFEEKPYFDASKTTAALADSAMACPKIDRAQLQVYLNQFAARGFLTA